jgi:hypothetical protein
VGIQNVRNFKSQMVMTMSTLKLMENRKTSQVDLERQLTKISEVMKEVKVSVECWRGSDTISLWEIDTFKVRRRMAKT